jgi:hypothetical protein
MQQAMDSNRISGWFAIEHCPKWQWGFLNSYDRLSWNRQPLDSEVKDDVMRIRRKWARPVALRARGVCPACCAVLIVPVSP